MYSLEKLEQNTRILTNNINVVCKTSIKEKINYLHEKFKKFQSVLDGLNTLSSYEHSLYTSYDKTVYYKTSEYKLDCFTIRYVINNQIAKLELFESYNIFLCYANSIVLDQLDLFLKELDFKELEVLDAQFNCLISNLNELVENTNNKVIGAI